MNDNTCISVSENSTGITYKNSIRDDIDAWTKSDIDSDYSNKEASTNIATLLCSM